MQMFPDTFNDLRYHRIHIKTPLISLLLYKLSVCVTAATRSPDQLVENARVEVKS